MIVYKIDQPSQIKATNQIKEMGAVLSEIAPSLRMLQEVLRQHESSISMPSLNNYRYELHNTITEAIRLTHNIAIQSQKLVTVSEQVSRPLASLDGQVSALVASKEEPKPAAASTPKEQKEPTVVTPTDNKNFSVFHRQTS